MTCDKCTDIHTAQREGKTTKECECNCHNETIRFPMNPTYIPYCPPDPCCPVYPYWQVIPQYQPTYTTPNTTCQNVSRFY